MSWTYTCGLMVFVLHINHGTDSKVLSDDNIPHSRLKRYVAFPEGASITMAFCVSVSVLSDDNIFTEGINWGLSYDLPNSTSFLEYKNSKLLLKHRQRRDIYNRLEGLMYGMGHNGKACLSRAICESHHRPLDQKMSLSEELLRILFRYPQYGDVAKSNAIFEESHRIGQDHRLADIVARSRQECALMYPDCPVSLIDLALGYYDTHL